MHCVDEWGHLHNLEKPVLREVLSRLRSGALTQLPAVFHSGSMEAFHSGSMEAKADAAALDSQDGCLDTYINPAFDQYFDNLPDLDLPDLTSAFAGIEFRDNLGENAPHTRDDGPECDPVVVMAWQNRPEDLMCLAHEVAHALQINLSGHAFMPPVAREVCAFLGELLLLDWCRKSNGSLCSHLLDVWREDNKQYLGEDVKSLAEKISEPKAPYHYRMNYPLARIMAVYLFENWTPKQIFDLFTSGSAAMALLPFERLAKTATRGAATGVFRLPDTGQQEKPLRKMEYSV